MPTPSTSATAAAGRSELLPFVPPAWRHDLLVSVIGLLLLLAWDVCGLDRPIARLYGDDAGFAWQHHWLTSRVLHDGGRWLGFLGLALLAVNVWRPGWPGPTRRQRLVALASTVLCVIAVPALKQISSTSCPWDLAEFGGVAAYVSHWQFNVTDGGPGRCFPSGHAVTAFAFLSVVFMWRETRPELARAGLLAVLAFGLLLGWGQLARGAHYPSHTFWSAWLCHAICALGALVAARAPHVAPAAAG